MTEQERDTKRLCRAITELLQVSRRRLISHPIFLALTQNGFSGFNEDFIHLTVDMIDKLTYKPETAAAVPPDPAIQETEELQQSTLLMPKNFR